MGDSVLLLRCELIKKADLPSLAGVSACDDVSGLIGCCDSIFSDFINIKIKGVCHNLSPLVVLQFVLHQAQADVKVFHVAFIELT